MTKDEIKKALEICTDIYAPCNGCPYEKCTNCDNTLHTDALKLIIEQEQEIEKLKEKCKELSNEKCNAQDELDCYYDEMPNKIKRAKIDVLNKLKDSYGLYYLSAFGVKERMLADILNPMIEELKK